MKLSGISLTFFLVLPLLTAECLELFYTLDPLKPRPLEPFGILKLRQAKINRSAYTCQ